MSKTDFSKKVFKIKKNGKLNLELNRLKRKIYFFVCYDKKN